MIVLTSAGFDGLSVIALARRRASGPSTEEDEVAPPTIPIAERLRRRSRHDPESGCIVWTGYSDKGYGSLQIGKGTRRVHILAWEMLNGPVPEGLQLDHKCRNRACMNPAHLEPVTARENIMRGVSHVARQAVATHCKRGHEFNEQNTIRGRVKRRDGITTTPTRGCRICKSALQRARRTAAKEKTMAHKTKQAALEAARKALGADAVENVDFTIKNTGAGYTHEEMPPANAAAEKAQAKRAVKPKADPKPKAAAKPKAPKKVAKAATAPKTEATPKAAGPNKTQQLVAMMQQPGGATSAEMEAAVGWQPHSVRGLLGTLRKAGTAIISTKNGKEPTYYQIKASEPAPPVGDVL